MKILLLLTAMLFLVKISKGQCSEYDIINLKKIAIVLGEKDYKNGPLTNPINDAKDMSDSLKKMGFDVYTYYNTDYKTMKGAIEEWYNKIAKYDVALFYYSGHGAEVNGRNYLFPIDASVRSVSDLEYVAYSANRILSNMEISNSKFNIMILDACRDNPFTKSLTRDMKGGLASMTGKGSFVGFASSPGTVASDGDRRNGIYTEAILKFISLPNLTIDQIFTRVNSYVRTRTSDVQIPYKNSSLSSDFCFNVKSERPYNNVKKSIIIQPSSGILLASNEERIFTSDSLNSGLLIKDSRTLNDISTLENGKIHPYKMTAQGVENVYVIDTVNQALSIFDSKKGILMSNIKLPYKPFSIVVSSDERKAYISNQQVAHNGNISVIDLVKNKVIKEIDTDDYSQALTIAPNGKYLYAISRCNLGENNIYVIDIKTDKVIKSVEGLSCGEAIGILPNNNKIYVSNLGKGGINQVNVLNANSLKLLKVLDLKSRSFSFTSDSKYVFSLGDSEISIIRTEDDVVVNSLPFATSPQGVAISNDGRAFVWLPKEYRTKVFSVVESLQSDTPIDPETLLRNFKEELKKKANSNSRYDLDSLFNKTRAMLDEVVYEVSRDLGNTFEGIQTGMNYNYKESAFYNQYGIQSKFDNTKKIWPLFQAKFTDDLLIILIKDSGKEETLKLPMNKIDWSEVKKFTRNFYLKRVDQLR